MEIPPYDGPAKTLRENDDRKKEITHIFNTELFWMLDLMIRLCPAHDFERIKAAAATARSYDYYILIMATGPYLFNYSDNIKARNLGFINEAIVSKHIDEKNISGDIDSAKSFILGIFAAVKKEYNKMNGEEKNIIHNKIEKMLNLYRRFLLLELDEKDIKGRLGA